MHKVDTYYFKELAFESVFPTFALQFFSDLENLVYSTGYHAHGLRGLSRQCHCLFDDSVLRDTHRPSFHRKRLSRSSLAIGEYTNVISISAALCKL